MSEEVASINDAARLYSRSCWRGFERCVFERMQQPDLNLLAEFARAFRINRQFPGTDGDQPNTVYLPVLDSLASIARPTTQTALVSAVKTLSSEARIGGEALSAASKFIWARSPEVGVIYDSRARGSLAKLRKATADRTGRMTDYETFIRVWNAVLEQRRGELEHACREHGLTEPWAERRLLDYWLYLNGPPPTSRKRRDASA